MAEAQRFGQGFRRRRRDSGRTTLPRGFVC
jgi:hypothetical protein